MVPTAVKREKLNRFNQIVSAGYDIRIAERRLKTTTRTLSRWSEELGIRMAGKKESPPAAPQANAQETREV